MKLLATLIFVLLITDGVHTQTLTDLKPEQYFDFWVGTWKVEWDEGDGQKGGGINRIEEILDGAALQEHFETTYGQRAGFLGTSISVYRPSLGTWKQAWADNQGWYGDFTGIFEDDKRIFQTDTTYSPDGRPLIQRMVFYDIKQDSFLWDWESSPDGGKTWNLQWRIHYTRKQ